MVDYAFDPAKTHSYYDLSNANRTVTSNTAGTSQSAISDWSKNSGKWYWEVTVNNTSGTYAISVGFCDQSGDTDFNKDVRAGWNESWALLSQSTSLREYHDGLYTSITGETWLDGDVVMIALDIDAGKAWFGKNGTWYESGNPATAANPQFNDASIIGNIISACVSLRALADQVTVNFGTSSFMHTPPSGFSGLYTGEESGIIKPSMLLVF